MVASPQTRRDGDGESSGGIGTLHRDALYEIPLRVPAKPLCRFRAVCRSWRSLLSAPSSFVAAHAARHRRDQPLLAVCDWVPGSDDKPAEIKLLDTSGHVVKRLGVGPWLLLCRVWPHLDLVLIVRRVAATDNHPRPLSVLDPATGDVSLLPDGHDNYGARDITHSSFVFGRTGGGGDGEYKVLSLSTSLHYGMRNLCKILTVNAGGGSHGEWRDAPAPPVLIETFHRHTLVASGMVYHLVDRSNGSTIAAFDLEAEQWLPDLLHCPSDAPVPLPPARRERRSLAEVNRRLAAVYSTASTMDLWLLMGSGDKAQYWCKQCRVLTSSMDMEWYERLGADPEPLWVLDDGRVAFWRRSRHTTDGILRMYDPRTQTCTRLAYCLKFGASVYTGNLLRQQVQYAHGMEELFFSASLCSYGWLSKSTSD